MSVAYEVMYRVGFTPWERAGELGAEQIWALLSARAGSGRALDIGCGTGQHTIALAERGWEAVGIDNVGRALAKARRRPDADKVTFTAGDVTRLGDHVEGPFSFFLDIGCFHGLTTEQRAAVGSQVTELATGDATLLMMAFGPNKVPVLPGGVDRADIETAFPSWRVDHVEPASVEQLPKPVQAAKPTFYRLVRS